MARRHRRNPRRHSGKIFGMSTTTALLVGGAAYYFFLRPGATGLHGLGDAWGTDSGLYGLGTAYRDAWGRWRTVGHQMGGDMPRGYVRHQ
jgi:hypothetical protein